MNTHNLLRNIYPSYDSIKKITPSLFQIGKLKNMISEQTNVPVILFLQKTRTREKIMAVMYFSVIIAIFTKLSLKQIGSLTNNDHATILHRIKTLYNLYQTEKEVKKIFDTIIHNAGKILYGDNIPNKWYNKYISKSLFIYAISLLNKEIEQSYVINFKELLEEKNREIRFLKLQIERMKIKEINYYEK